MKGEPHKIRVTMTYDRTMNWDRFWDWADLTIQQINEGRRQRMIELGSLTYERISRDEFIDLIRQGSVTLKDDLGSYGVLYTILTYTELEDEEDERTGGN